MLLPPENYRTASATHGSYQPRVTKERENEAEPLGGWVARLRSFSIGFLVSPARRTYNERGKRRMKSYTVIYERGSRNWSAYVPDLPGCIATARTRKQLEKLIREAIEFHIEGLCQQGEPVPEPTIEAGIVCVTV